VKQVVMAVLFVVAWQSTSVLAQSKTVPVVAVFDMTSRESGLKPGELAGLTDYLATRLGEKGLFQIIPREEIRKRLAIQKTDSFKKCYDRSCQIEVGRELAAQYTVSTSISRVGTLCLINGQLFDLRKAATLKTASAKKPCNPDELIVAIEEISDKLQSAMGGAAVVEPKIEEQPKPKEELAASEPVSPPITESTSPPPPTERPVEPVSYTPWYKTWWFWTMTGVVLAGAGISIAAVLTDGFSSSTGNQTAAMTVIRF
jgi:TolB-like protein